MMNSIFVVRSVSAIACTFLLAGNPAASEDQKKPSINIRANPTAGFSPLRVVLTAEIKGGSDDFKEFYCPTVEWDWGDDTRAESTADCEPYQEGKSEIRRRYTVSRIFQTSGNYKVAFRLKQKDKVVGASTTTVQVRPGLRDRGVCCDVTADR
jgi:hypothetical protein